MSITNLLPKYPPIALDPANLITEVYASLPETKQRTVKPQDLRVKTIDAWIDRRDHWIVTVGEYAAQKAPGITEHAETIVDALCQVNEEYASQIELGDSDFDGFALGFALAVLRWNELDQAGMIPDFDWTDDQVQAWINNHAVEVPDVNGQFRLF